MTSTTLRHRTKTNFFGTQGNPNGTMDLEAFLTDAGMDYGIELVPAEYQWGGETRQGGDFHLVRTSDGNRVGPHTVSKQYSPITPLDMIEELKPYCAEGWAAPEAAFTMKDGDLETVALLLDPDQLPDSIGMDEDIRWYIVAKNRHGRGAAEGSVFGERVICTNGMTALSRLATFRIPHRGSGDGAAAARFQRAVRNMEAIRTVISDMSKRMGLLLDIPMSHQEAETLANVVTGIETLQVVQGRDFGHKQIDYTDKSVVSTQRRNLHAATLDAFHMPRFGTEGKTALDFYNGVTWVGSHWTPERSKQTDSDIVEGLLDGTRGSRELATLTALDAFAAFKS